MSISRVPVCYGRFYFNAFERFDCLMYQFEFSGTPNRKVFSFIPECEIPDSFYQTRDKRVSFESFCAKSLFDIDNAMEWVKAVDSMIRQYPEPRKPGHRPVPEKEEVVADADSNGSQAGTADAATRTRSTRVANRWSSRQRCLRDESFLRLGYGSMRGAQIRSACRAHKRSFDGRPDVLPLSVVQGGAGRVVLPDVWSAPAIRALVTFEDGGNPDLLLCEVYRSRDRP